MEFIRTDLDCDDDDVVVQPSKVRLLGAEGRGAVHQDLNPGARDFSFLFGRSGSLSWINPNLDQSTSIEIAVV